MPPHCGFTWPACAHGSTHWRCAVLSCAVLSRHTPRRTTCCHAAHAPLSCALARTLLWAWHDADAIAVRATAAGLAAATAAATRGQQPAATTGAMPRQQPAATRGLRTALVAATTGLQAAATAATRAGLHHVTPTQPAATVLVQTGGRLPTGLTAGSPMPGPACPVGKLVACC